MENQVIKNLSPEMGKEIIKYAQSLGINTSEFKGTLCEADGDSGFYYGVINGFFSCYSLEQVQEANATIIELPTLKKEPQRGDEIMVWDDNNKPKNKRLFLAKIEGAEYPIICVSKDSNINEPPFKIIGWEYYELIPEQTETEKKIKYHEEQIEILKNK